ncbi:S1C family serine protease [Ideonella sp. BN130291]|uniref:S1C family serine protease n=1 Tax=Ideonella sp. BN130291 TaxID=3112940 RepID=UPI002E271D7E|nr:S1C family serine protease [Ideonella sp. BN130291]
MRSTARPPTSRSVWIRWALCLLAALSWVGALAGPEPGDEAQSRALGRASDAVVGVRAIAVEGARSTDSLGPARQGSGVVIGPDDLVLTIGYLIIEADQVQLLLDDGRELPARVVAYDQDTGFGLVQALAPLRLEPVPLGDAQQLQAEEPLMVVSGGEQGGISLARLVSQRAFSGFWEYHIDNALFTAPARMDHSGAALFNARGELLGIGSLLVHDAMGEQGPRLPGNMFVPVDLLKPILGELRAQGMSARSRRAWMGVNCIELGGAVRVVRVSNDSPAAVAGLQPGDRILRIDGTEVGELATLWKQLWDGGQPEREVTLDIRRGDEARRVTMKTVDRMTTLKHAQGI